MARFLTSIILVSLIFMQSARAHLDSFFSEKYRGWRFGEEKAIEEELAAYKTEIARIPTADEANNFIEEKQREMTDARNIMLNVMWRDEFTKEQQYEAVREYRQLEASMQDMSMAVGDAWSATNILHPDLIDEYNYPSNIYARKLQKEAAEQENEADLRELAASSMVYVFRNGSCKYCHPLEKNLNRWATEYGFKVKAVSPDNSKSEYFSNIQSLDLVRSFGVKVAPTVFVVTSDGHKYEIGRGMQSQDGLSQNALGVVKLLKENIYTAEAKGFGHESM